MLELLTCGLWLIEFLFAVTVESGASSGPVAGAAFSPGPRVFGEQTWSVETGELRRWSRRRARRGDIIEMIEFRSHPMEIPRIKNAAIPGPYASHVAGIQRGVRGTVYVESDGLVLVVRACGAPDSVNIALFRARCQAFLRDLRSAAVPGQLKVGAGACPVCKQQAPAASACAVCRTPHHRDCLRYAGKCAVFGCSGRGLL